MDTPKFVNGASDGEDRPVGDGTAGDAAAPAPVPPAPPPGVAPTGYGMPGPVYTTGYPPAGGYPPAARPQAPSAMIALILGIVSIVSCQPLGIAAIIFARKTRREIEESQGYLDGGSYATVGMVCGGIALGLFCLIIVFYAAFFLFAITAQR